jgi:hypothetical protein
MTATPILLDPSKTHAFTPEPNGPTFHLRVPTVADRVKAKRALAAEGGRQWSYTQRANALAEAIETLLPDEADAEHRELLAGAVRAYRDRIEAAAATYRADRSEASLKELGEAIMADELVRNAEALVLAAGRTRYSEMLADLEVFAEIRGIVYAQMFVEGWEGEGMPAFAKAGRGVTEDALAQVESRHLVAVGGEVASLLEPEANRLKN